MSEWQPISTAPNALRVLVYVPAHTNDRGNPGRIVVATKSWQQTMLFVTVPGRYSVHPTHWMPLPEPPQ